MAIATKLKVSAIQNPSSNNTVVVQNQLKESVETAQRLRGDPMDSFVRVSELTQGGLWQLVNGVLIPSPATVKAGAAIVVSDSIAGDGTTTSPLQLSGDASSPGNSMQYGTNSSGTKGWYPQPAGGSITVKDGSTTIAGATTVTFAGAIVSGTTPNATVTITGGSSAYTKISEQILTTATTTITFSSIPNTYRNLVLRMTCAATVNTGPNLCVRFNGDTGNNYTGLIAFGQLSGGNSSNNVQAASSMQFNSPMNNNGLPNQPTAVSWYIHDYARTVWNKTLTGMWWRHDSTGGFGGTMSGSWESIAAITDIEIFLGSGNFVTGSVFSLYGES